METEARMQAESRTGLCPSCGAGLVFGERLLVGETLTCDRCAAALEVAGLRPLVFQLRAKVEEDEEDFMR